MRPALELLGDLAEQTRSFVQVELSLLRADSVLVTDKLRSYGAAKSENGLSARSTRLTRKQSG